MNGTDKNTGRLIPDLEHLKQSITDILTTRIGSRVMRREYGSILPYLIDAPFNEATRLDMIVATGDALARWEPRYLVQSVLPTQTEEGVVEISLTGIYLPDGTTINLDGIRIAA
ncbi:MAG: GPW/gp25 family protein [Vibrio sp.]